MRSELGYSARGLISGLHDGTGILKSMSFPFCHENIGHFIYDIHNAFGEAFIIIISIIYM